MTRADEVRAPMTRAVEMRLVAGEVAAALRAYAELIEAAEELLAARDAPPRADIEGAMAAGKAYDAAWERLRRAVRREDR